MMAFTQKIKPTGVLLAVSIIFLFIYFFNQDAPQAHRITLQNGEFEPSQLTVQTGDRVAFQAAKNAFWPASDPHPIHNYYTEGAFDPQRPLAADEEWQFTFKEAGVWGYHDHLNPSARGEITVLPRRDVATAECKKDTGQCFDELIRKTVSEKGIAAAYALFTETYARGELPRACHWTAHQIGEEAYELFREGKKFPITDETSYCGYGFFHGFMEGLLRENPDIEYALSFCNEVEKQLGLLGLQNCYHGIGHGYTEDPPDPRVRGNFEAMIAPGIEVCEYLFKNSYTNLNLCLTGVFTVPAGFAEKGEYGLSLDRKDPFAVCRTQPYRYQKACYGEITPKFDTLLDGDFAQFPTYLSGITDSNIRNLIIWVAPSVFVARDILKDDFGQFIQVCRSNFTGNERNICWGGIILGLFTHGEPEKQYKKGISLCESSLFDKQEKDFCYAQLFHRIHSEYKNEKVQNICREEIPRQYTKHCLDNNQSSVYKDPEFK